MCSLPVGSMKPVSLAFLLFVCLFHALWTYAVSSTYQLCNLSDSSFLLTYKGGDNYIYFIRWLWDSSDKICHKCLQHNTWQTLRWCSNWETVWYGSICCVVAVLLLSLLLLLSSHYYYFYYCYSTESLVRHALRTSTICFYVNIYYLINAGEHVKITFF